MLRALEFIPFPFLDDRTFPFPFDIDIDVDFLLPLPVVVVLLDLRIRNCSVRCICRLNNCLKYRFHRGVSESYDSSIRSVSLFLTTSVAKKIVRNPCDVFDGNVLWYRGLPFFNSVFRSVILCAAVFISIVESITLFHTSVAPMILDGDTNVTNIIETHVAVS